MMPVKGGDKVRRNTKNIISNIRGIKTPEVLQEVMIIGLANAARLTPVDTGNLLQSQFKRQVKTSTGYRGTAGYTASYAPFVHDKKGQDFKKAAAENEFLIKGFERDGKNEIRAAIVRGYRV